MSLMIGCKPNVNSAVRRRQKQTDLRSTQKFNEAAYDLHRFSENSFHNYSGDDPAPSIMRAQQQPARPLTLEEAVSLARSHNRELKEAGIEIHKQKEALSEAKTQLYPRFDTYLLASELLNPLDFTIPVGTLGTFPATVPFQQKNPRSTPQLVPSQLRP